ncbi:BON domain-containing protein [Variovorax sp. SRS16]|uniref:BON domain-containing protein n=1 Tax=Variovorax sp. SRS16 TaxID=282217 RepID=UPI001E63366B|nr:BON domain-containing protein [Variovorax sp. SRS16]
MPPRPASRFPLTPRACRNAMAALLATACTASVALAQTTETAASPEKKNWFDDPFLQIASGARGCPVPEGPLYTEAERREQIHSRLERGTTCWLAGQCADSNAYRYDKPLAPKVQAALATVPGARRSSVWAIIQRRWIYLQGCVPSEAVAHRLERAARAVPDVELVVPDLMVGTHGKPPYAVAASWQASKDKRPPHNKTNNE